MRLTIYVRMRADGTEVKLIDRDTGEILHDWYDPSSDPQELPCIVMDAVAFYRSRYKPDRVYFDVERVVNGG